MRLSYTDSNKDGVIQPRQYFQRQCDDVSSDPWDIPNCIDIWKPGEIVEVNNYYPFGLLHDYTATSQNAYQYKYNGKELQETGMYAMDFRNYMPDIGRFSAADPFSGMTPGWTPYRFGFNNPVNFSDPSGLFEEMGYTGTESLSLGDSVSGNELMWPTKPGSSKNETFTDSDGTFTWDGSMWRDSNGDGVSHDTVDIEEIEVGKSNASPSEDSGSSTISSMSWWANTATGGVSTANLPRTGFLKYNELWHQTKTRGVSFSLQNKWKNPGAKFWRGQQVKPLQGARNLGTKLTAAGGVLLAADIAMSGEVKASHYINGIMLGASTTGVGSIVAGVWFVADMGTGAVNYLNGNGFKTLSDVIDESSVGQSISFEMYDGLY